MRNFSWQATYVILGILGFIWVIPWLIINKSNPDKHPWITDEERALISNDSSVDHKEVQKTDEGKFKFRKNFKL